MSARTFKVTFLPSGRTVDVKDGHSVLDGALAHGIALDHACGGVCACSTCHVILPKAYFDKVPEPSEAEEDMLDLALGLTPTSRLGCQVFAAPELDGMEIVMPKEVNNMQGDK